MGEGPDAGEEEEDNVIPDEGPDPVAPAAAPAQPPVAHGDSRREVDVGRLEAILAHFDITIAEANDLVVLDEYEMVVIADDSGSMASSAEPAHHRQLGGPKITRWDELKNTISLIVELGGCFDKDGLDIHFLNRDPVLQCASKNDPRLVASLARGPAGTTPLREALQRGVGGIQGEKPVLLFVATDGVPNGGVEPVLREVENIVQKRTTNHKIKFQFMACTSDDEDVGWLNQLDKAYAEVDTTDDYFTELDEVLQAGRRTKFTRGDWCLKAMLGPISQKFDGWDEKSPKAQKSSACVLL